MNALEVLAIVKERNSRVYIEDGELLFAVHKDLTEVEKQTLRALVREHKQILSAHLKAHGRPTLRIVPDDEQGGTQSTRSYYSYDELLAQPDPRWLVGDVIVAGGFTQLNALPKLAKSLMAIDLAMRLATLATEKDRGWWNGAKLARGQHRVLYVLAEGQGFLKDRLLAWTLKHKCQHVEADRLRVRTSRIEFDDPRSVDLLLAEHGGWLTGHGDGLALVVVDTLNRCLKDGENDPEAMNGFNAGTERIRLMTGAAVLALHHTPKDGRQTGRGFSGVEYGADNVLFIEGQPALPVIKVVGGASRNSVSGGEFYLRKESWELGRTDADTGEQVTAPVIVEATADDWMSQQRATANGQKAAVKPDLTARILKFVEDNPRCTKSAIEGGVPAPSRTVLRERVDEMVSEGLIVQTPDGKVGGRVCFRYESPIASMINGDSAA
jgi:hypothetical protein